MTLHLGFFEVSAQVIPVFLLAMMVEAAVAGQREQEHRERFRRHRYVVARVGLAIGAEAACLGVIATNHQDIGTTILVLVGLGAAASGALVTYFDRVDAYSHVPAAFITSELPLVFAFMGVIGVIGVAVGAF